MTGQLKARVGGAWVPVSGANEVEVSPIDPIASNPTAELWYDTDGIAAVTNDLRWHTAWGVIAKGTLNYPPNPIIPVSTWGNVTNNLPITALAGRRYRIILNMRAWSLSAAGSANVRASLDAVSLGERLLRYDGTWPHLAESWTFDGDGAVHILSCQMTSAISGGVTAYTDFFGEFYCEDIGPVTGSTAAPLSNDQAWNTAWGIVAMGTMKPLSAAAINASTETAITENLVYQTIVGRRYRLFVRSRAAAPNPTGGYIYIRLNGSGIGSNDGYRVLSGSYDTSDAQVIFNGTGIVGTYYATVFGAQNFLFWADQVVSHFYLEDVGPINPFAPVPSPTPAWIAPTFTNGHADAGSADAVGYRKIGDLVYLRGRVRLKTPVTSMFTLPVGYRPNILLDVGSTMWSGSAWVAARFYIVNDGTIVCDFPAGYPDQSLLSLNVAPFSVTP